MATRQSKNPNSTLVPAERIAASIYLVRGTKVLFDFDLSILYDVPTRTLNQAVSRNLERFPEDFMFRLTGEELDELNRSQIVIGSSGLKHRDPKFAPRAFTQEGIAMLSGVLKSKRAIEVNIGIMRTFVRMREFLATNEELARRVDQHDQEITVLFEHVRTLLEPPPMPGKRAIGFC